MSGFFSALYAITLMDTSGAVVFGILSFTSIFVALIGVVLNFIYLYSLRRISEHASKAESNKELYEEAQQEAMEEAVEALWPNKDSETGKISYRDSVWKLKRTLNENGLDSLVEFQRGRFRVNKNTASCDAWDVIHGNSSVTSIVSYLPTYEWAMNNEAEIMDILEEHQKTTLKKI